MPMRLKSTAQGIYTKIERAEIDNALDTGQIFAQMNDGSYQKMRRNGATRTWKKSPERLVVPFKHGFRGFGRITERHLIDGHLHPDYFRHVSDLVEVKRK